MPPEPVDVAGGYAAAGGGGGAGHLALVKKNMSTDIGGWRTTERLLQR